MRLIRFGERGREKPGMLDGQGAARDLSGVIADINGATLAPAVLDRLRALDPTTLPLVPARTRLGPCVGGVRNLVCIGLNYSDHAAETNTPIPSQPVVFNKHVAALSGPNDPVILPAGSEKLDWEVEIALVIGRPCWNVAQKQALNHLAGYCVMNDVSERAYQLEMAGQWTKGKSFFSFAPLGPWLVTADEVPDPQALSLWLDVNGKPFQRGTASKMIFGVAEIVSYLSRFMALQPGDVIATGTPPGVGLGQKPPVFLRAGDRIQLGVEGLGEQQQDVVAFTDDMAASWNSGETLAS